MSSPYQKAYFLLSVANIEQLPADVGYEVAIVGRSNAGKSTVVNKITRKGLARVSKTPGRTQMINFFVIDAERRLADLPGYGYAKAQAHVKAKWQKTVDSYLSMRKSLKGLVLVMDIRHPLKPLDIELLKYCQHYALPVHILLNKMDKLSKNQAFSTRKKVASALTEFGNSVSLQCFSALSGEGLAEFKALLDKWYAYS